MGDLGPTREQSGSGLLEHIMSKSPKAIVAEDEYALSWAVATGKSKSSGFFLNVAGGRSGGGG